MAGMDDDYRTPWQVDRDKFEVWVVYRTYPIRVAGNSGPLIGETTWEALGLDPELTTVTRKVRRVGTWNASLSRKAMAANGHVQGIPSSVHAALTMADYLVPGLKGATSAENLDDEIDHTFHRLLSSRSSDLGRLIELVGTGPRTLIDLR